MASAFYFSKTFFFPHLLANLTEGEQQCKLVPIPELYIRNTMHVDFCIEVKMGVAVIRTFQEYIGIGKSFPLVGISRMIIEKSKDQKNFTLRYIDLSRTLGGLDLGEFFPQNVHRCQKSPKNCPNGLRFPSSIQESSH